MTSSIWANKVRFMSKEERSKFFQSRGKGQKKESPRNPIGKAKMLSPSEFDFAAEKAKERMYGARDTMLILISRYCGLRAKEIASIHFEDITDARGNLVDELHVSARGAKYGKARTVPLRHELVEAFREYLALVGISSGPIFWTQRGVPMTSNAVQKQIRATYDACGFDRTARSHSGRRSFITRLAQNANTVGGSLEDVRVLAGHANLETTSGYIERSPNAARLIDLI